LDNNGSTGSQPIVKNVVFSPRYNIDCQEIVFSERRDFLRREHDGTYINLVARCIEGGPSPGQSIRCPDNRDRCGPDNGSVQRGDRPCNKSLYARRRFRCGGRSEFFRPGILDATGSKKDKTDQDQQEYVPDHTSRKTEARHWLIFVPGIHKILGDYQKSAPNNAITLFSDLREIR
jgi:hypothetical protein